MTEIIIDENIDWDARVMCCDEPCIGTIGPDGKCKECGKPYEGVLPEGHGRETVQPAATDEAKAVSSEDAGSDDEWEKRMLCSDGACFV